MRADDPRHGTNAGAMKHWRDGEPTCDGCKRATTRARLARQIAAERGQPRTVALGEAAWTVLVTSPRNHLCKTVGMQNERVGRYVKAGPTMRIHRTTRDRILAYRPEWSIVGIQRRLRALTSLGWSTKAQAAHSGISMTALYDLRSDRPSAFVRMATAEAIVAMYQELCMKVPPRGASSTEARNEAIRKGYAPPLTFDDIDDPTETPKGLERVGNTTEIRATRAVDLEHFAHMGDTLETACERLDVNPDTLWKWCNRHGHADLYERLAERTRRGANQWTEGRRTA